MRIMGLDLGDKTIGVAVSDSLGWTAQALETVTRKDIETDIEKIRELIREWEVGKIVVDFPKT